VAHVVRELLSNVVRHAHASRATVSVDVADGAVTVIVADDGIGTGAGRTPGHGLTNIRERARAVGGTARVEERDGGGTLVTWTATQLQ
jgi:signal transduction histidine kinase